MFELLTRMRQIDDLALNEFQERPTIYMIGCTFLISTKSEIVSLTVPDYLPLETIFQPVRLNKTLRVVI